MTDKHESYDESLEEYASEKIDFVFLAIYDELDNIEQRTQSEASKVLLSWVRDAIQRVSETHKP